MIAAITNFTTKQTAWLIDVLMRHQAVSQADDKRRNEILDKMRRHLLEMQTLEKAGIIKSSDPNY